MRITPLALGVAALSAAACSDTTAPLEPAVRRAPSTELAPAVTAATSPLSVTGVTSRTGSPYRAIAAGLKRGATVYTDRSYTFSTVPTAVTNASYLQTPNNDKAALPGSGALVSFRISQDATIYIAHDDLIARPRWLAAMGFTDSGLDLVTTDGGKKLSLFRKAFPAGTVTLGSNADAVTDNSMFIVAIVGAGTVSTPTPAPSDTVRPTVAITAPAAGATVAGTVGITASAADAVGLAGVTFQVDGTTLGAEDTTAPYAATWSTTAVANGAHTVTAIARDAAGNRTSVSRTVTVSNTQTVRRGFYVSPTGSSAGTGSSTSPWTLATVLAHPSAVQPGDTVWVRGGTYTGRFVSKIAGTSTAPIIVRAYPGERARIDGSLRVDGRYAWYWGLELFSSAIAASHISGLDFYGPGNRAINTIVHNQGGNGIGVWAEAPGSEVYGSLLFHNGRQRVDPGFAHGLYGQNNGATTRIVDNIMFQQMGYGLHLYGSDAAYLRNFTVEGNVSFQNGQAQGSMDFHIGGSTPVENLRFVNNFSYRTDVSSTARFGYGWGPANRGAVISDNTFVGKVLFDQWTSLSFERNTVVKPAQYEAIAFTPAAGASYASFRWNANSYFKPTSTGGVPFAAYGSLGSFAGGLADWRARTGFDQASSFSAALPTSQRVIVRPNAYEPGRANVIVYNWSGASTASVDLAGILPVGRAYEIRNVQTYFGAPVVTGTYTGGSVTIPITTVTPTAPVGGWPSGTPSTGRTFQVFVVLPR